MQLLSRNEMLALEERAISAGVLAETLMEEAGALIAQTISEFYPRPGVCYAVFGKGNNGGDSLVAARHLAAAGWHVWNLPVQPMDQWSALTRKKFLESGTRGMYLDAPPPDCFPAIVLDGVLGVGARAPVGVAMRQRIMDMNRLRARYGVHVFAIDLPSGIDPDSGAVLGGKAPHDEPLAVFADTTLTIGFPKKCLFEECATNHVGRIVVLPLRELTRRHEKASPAMASAICASPNVLRAIMPPRMFDSHKGQFGRVGIVAGSRGLTGAATMSADAAVRGGAGLVTLYATLDVHETLAIRCAPEVMVRPAACLEQALEGDHDVLAIGPGLGLTRASEMLEVIEHFRGPAVIDADALNALSENMDVLSRAVGPRLLTPHPGEMRRLMPECTEMSRAECATAFAAKYPTHTLILKGARSIVAQTGHPLSYNTTGHPGMASGGMGDVLTGLLVALLGQKLSPYDAARIGSWLLGRAGELAVFEGGESAQSLRASAVLAHFGPAFRALYRTPS